MSLRASSIFQNDGTDFSAEQEKVRLGLESGESVATDTSLGDARSQRNRRERVVVCYNDSSINAGKQRLAVPSVFTCNNSDSLCQRDLFLARGFILEINDPVMTTNAFNEQ